jgi:hypothetical protein
MQTTHDVPDHDDTTCASPSVVGEHGAASPEAVVDCPEGEVTLREDYVPGSPRIRRFRVVARRAPVGDDPTFDAVADRLDLERLWRSESFDQLCERLEADLLEDVQNASDMEQVLALLAACLNHRELDELLSAKLISLDEYAHARDFLGIQAVVTVALTLLPKAEGRHLAPRLMLAALRWDDENMAPWYGRAARTLFMEELRKERAVRQQMVDLTSHLTVRQAEQVTGIGKSTISRRREIMEGAPTLIERVAALEARTAELERQVGVLPDERVSEEVDVLLRSLDLGGQLRAA